MRTVIRMGMATGLLIGNAAFGQGVIESNQSVASDTPEAWAMRYFAGTTLMTSFGASPNLAPLRWNVALDVGSIPRLSDAQQRVGFGGFKNEDLNKSPVIGRLRLALGLPGNWIAELGYTPPLAIEGSRARNLVALAMGRRLLDDHGLSISMRALGQAGKVQGDITCPARLARVADLERNPYGCTAPSKDTFTTNYYGIDSTLGWDAGNGKWHASAGIVRTQLSVQVDAQVFTSNDRSRLATSGNLGWLAIGGRYDLDSRWSLAAELLYVPLDVRRPPDFGVDKDSLSSVRASLRYSAD